jgi:hypothetical protein
VERATRAVLSAVRIAKYGRRSTAETVAETVPDSDTVRVGQKLEVWWDTPKGYFLWLVLGERVTLISDRETKIEHRVLEYEDQSTFWHNFDQDT